ncbi:patatin-like phospholipase family protein [Bradyrhizobium sp. 186]|uniref:patatin-like phospholipase family protein n=1 Tax=Bradyrhizobium sp. 186 TaxID=2782654 RepID=UPI00200129C9|nr:patatin-like phospholipase family protein [Bradyrhizobium sp. 186]UPK34993.1 patatin-like phospholipase family protein [Bradyrhizobium sp. 186]
MRGVVSAGMVAALETLGLRDCFDLVCGSSAGAIAGAYFVAGQARYGATIFYENINNKNFVDLRRLVGPKPVVSLEFLLDTVCISQKPLRFDRILQGDLPLYVVASSLNEKKAVMFGDFDGQQELIEALRGSARIPFFAGPPVPFRGDHLLDASVYESIPFRSVLSTFDVTDVVVLLTRPAGDLRSEPNWIDRNIVARNLSKFSGDFAVKYLERPSAYRDEFAFIQSRSAATEPPYFLQVQPPSSSAKVGSRETNRARLVRGAMDGYRAVYDALGQPAQQLAEIIAPFAAANQ